MARRLRYVSVRLRSFVLNPLAPSPPPQISSITSRPSRPPAPHAVRRARCCRDRRGRRNCGRRRTGSGWSRLTTRSRRRPNPQPSTPTTPSRKPSAARYPVARMTSSYTSSEPSWKRTPSGVNDVRPSRSLMTPFRRASASASPMSGTLGQSVAGGGGNTRGPRSPPIIVVTRWTNDRGSGLTSTDRYWMGMPEQFARNDRGARSNRQRDVRAVTCQLDGDLAGRVAGTDHQHTAPCHPIRPAISDAVHDASGEMLAAGNTRHVGIGGDPRGGHERSGLEYRTGAQLHLPSIAWSSDGRHIRRCLDREAKRLSVAVQVVDKDAA